MLPPVPLESELVPERPEAPIELPESFALLDELCCLVRFLCFFF